MTQQRDLKRRIRDRQTQTGESYVTARRRVLAHRDDEAPSIDVVEPLDATEDAARLGLRCRVLIFPAVTAQLAPALVLERVRDALLAGDGDPDLALLRTLALHGVLPPLRTHWMRDRVAARRFLERARAGIGGTSEHGHLLAMHVDGVALLCSAWRMHASLPPVLIITAIGELGTGAELFGP